ncbi:putative S-adenosylmethionine-dependent methyltransferase of the seven beta-strand family [Annulohypoxylon truncatum]|uniref:putative S-adenosylmethionine-dependent methyltransferase of the seven beta-strand family n=1 Tax=Annulohypoxylon truncatum TaxID=327061 RepID=UPI002007C779|nr:putative S-adenosylmethionine-dependent methyltransferase of the seven beta-strand family [Annulohypoxylon truncatum]KAI1213353.1 putative S-adenosylmethionine-dependent methyltransferase of the seven beta-strand family [Annulohypoxylon truncatum]
MSKPTNLEPSELGTKEYWDNLYTTELTNHAHNPSDTGTVWFDDSDAETKLIDFLSAPDLVPSLNLSQATTSFLDLGTGNGSLLFGLRDAGWAGRMLGVDYSRQSIEFARRLAQARISPDSSSSSSSLSDPDSARSDDDEERAGVVGRRENEQPITFLEHDILRTSPAALLTSAQSRGWDVVLDKGTFDAISLSSETDPATGRRVAESYRSKIAPLVREGGLFLVTSCNWTEAELRGWFAGPAKEGEEGEVDEETRRWRFEEVGRVKYPSFSFGGVKGQTISSLCFRKVRNIEK